MIRHLFLIRHGEAEHLVGEELTGGWTDSQLTDLGRKQAERLFEALPSWIRDKKAALYCSDLQRAYETAEILGRSLGLAPIQAKELRELNNGDAANKTRVEANNIFIPITRPIMDWVPYPNGESWRMLLKRSSDFMESIKNEEDELVIIVSHGNTIASIIHWWLELEEKYLDKINYDIKPCSVTYLRINSYEERVISSLNDTKHLLPLEAGHTIDHINRYVSNVDRFIEFYEGALGFKLIGRGIKQNGNRFAILQGFGHELFISEKEDFEAVDGKLRHIGFSVDNADRLLEELKNKGHIDKGQQVIVKKYSRQIYIKDPDGMEIDLIQWTDKDGFYNSLEIK